MIQIRLDHIFKNYPIADGREQKVLKDVSLTINQGDYVSIMGPSGSGKSTLMNILGLLDLPTSGDYSSMGQNVKNMSRDELASLRNKSLGFVFQGFNLLMRRTLLDNVAMPLIYTGWLLEKRKKRSYELLKAVGLEGMEGKRPNQLSGGQQQRVAIARAMANSPQIILADEPTGNLDTTTSQEIMKLFSSLNEKERITLIIVTHENDVAAYTKRLIELNDGIISYDGAVNVG